MGTADARTASGRSPRRSLGDSPRSGRRGGGSSNCDAPPSLRWTRRRLGRGDVNVSRHGCYARRRATAPFSCCLAYPCVGLIPRPPHLADDRDSPPTVLLHPLQRLPPRTRPLLPPLHDGRTVTGHVLAPAVLPVRVGRRAAPLGVFVDGSWPALRCLQAGPPLRRRPLPTSRTHTRSPRGRSPHASASALASFALGLASQHVDTPGLRDASNCAKVASSAYGLPHVLQRYLKSGAK